MSKDTKGLVTATALVAALIGLICVIATRAADKSQRRAAEARGPKLFSQGQEVTVKTTGERTIVVSVTAWAPTHRWQYWCRVVFGSKDYPIGVITNPTQITKTYELVDFYGFELEAR